MMGFQEHMKNARRVSTPLIAVRTFDAASAVRQVRTMLGQDAQSTPMIAWDAVQGFTGINAPGNSAAAVLGGPDATMLHLALKVAMDAPTDTMLFVSNAHLFWAERETIQAIWNLRDTYKASGNMLVLLCTAGASVPPELGQDVYTIDEELPTAAELADKVTEQYTNVGQPAPDAETISRATEALVGLPMFPAENSLAMCLKRSGSLDFPQLWQRKRDIVSQVSGLSVWSGSETLADVGGMDSVKRFITSVMTGRNAPSVIVFIDEIEKSLAGSGTDMSGVKTGLLQTLLMWMQDRNAEGILLYGVPGTSKSAIAKGTGGTFGRPVINLDINGLQNGIIGSTEQNARAATKTIDAISGGNPVLVLGTCNSFHSLPTELLRRFSMGKFFFDVPSKPERGAIWDIYRAMYQIATSDPLPNDEGWTGAEIRQCAKMAYNLRLSLAEASQYIVPVSRSAAETIHNLRVNATGKFLDASRGGTYEYQGQSVPGPQAFIAQPSARRFREDA